MVMEPTKPPGPKPSLNSSQPSAESKSAEGPAGQNTDDLRSSRVAEFFARFPKQADGSTELRLEVYLDDLGDVPTYWLLRALDSFRNRPEVEWLPNPAKVREAVGLLIRRARREAMGDLDLDGGPPMRGQRLELLILWAWMTAPESHQQAVLAYRRERPPGIHTEIKAPMCFEDIRDRGIQEVIRGLAGELALPESSGGRQDIHKAQGIGLDRIGKKMGIPRRATLAETESDDAYRFRLSANAIPAAHR